VLITNPNRKQKLEYSTIEFNLSNDSAIPVNMDLFDANNLVNIPNQNSIGSYPNILGQQITVGTTYDGLAYDSSRKNIIAGDASGNIKVISTSTGSVVFTTVSTVASDKMIYIAELDKIYSIGKIGVAGNTVAVINPVNGIEITTVVFPIGIVFTDLVFCPVNQTVYLKDSSGDQKVWFLSTTTNTNSGFVQPPLGGVSNYITYVSSNNSVYIYDFVLFSIFQLSCDTNTVVATIAAAGTAVIGAYSSVNNQIYYLDDGAGVIKIVNVSTNTIVGTTIAGFVPGIPITDMAYSSITNHIWMVDDGNDLIKVVSASTDTVVTSLGIHPDWSGQIVYADGINTAYTTPNLLAAGNYVQQIDATGNQFYINGSSDYNQFVLDGLVNPKKLDRIMIYAENNNNLLNSLAVTTEEATGDSCSVTRLPNTSVSSSQFQGAIGQVDFEDYILDVTSKINYTIPAFTTIKWVIYYKQYNRSEMMAGRVMIENFDVDKPIDPDTYDEKYLIDTQLVPNWVENIEINNFLETNNIEN